MQPQFDNQAMSSVLLWLDNKVLSEGSAYTNFGSRFYKVRDMYSGFCTYGLPFKQIIADSSIPGANIMSGIYINNTFVTTGVSGLVDIDYEQGYVYFTGNMQNELLSGDFAVKDFNVSITNEPEQKLIFETKYTPRPKTAQQLTGLAPNLQTCPAIFITNNGGYNAPFAFGGLDTTHMNIRLVVLADNQFNLDAVCSILRDTCKTYIPLLTPSEWPFNQRMGLKSGSYHYSNMVASKTNHADYLFISRVNISRFNYQSVIMTELRNLNVSIFPALIDLELEAVRMPRT